MINQRQYAIIESFESGVITPSSSQKSEKARKNDNIDIMIIGRRKHRRSHEIKAEDDNLTLLWR